VTLLRWTGNRMSDADVVLNRAYAYNSYRGLDLGAVSSPPAATVTIRSQQLSPAKESTMRYRPLIDFR
jgi:hypothetical protein